MLCVLENAIDAAATETHLLTERLEISCRTLDLVQACEAQVCKKQGRWKVRESTSQAGLLCMRICDAVMYDMLCDSEFKCNEKAGNDAVRRESKDALRWSA